MIRKLFQWLIANTRTLLLAFVMAVVVWFSAVLSVDPNVEHALAQPEPVEIIGQDPRLQIMGSPSLQTVLTLKAPASVWTNLNSNPDLVKAWVDLSGLGPGEHTLPVQVQIDLRLARLVQQEPAELTIVLETVVSQTFPVTVVSRGSLPTGYQADAPVLSPVEVTVSGPESFVAQVSEVRVSLDIANASQTIERTLTPTAVDADGRTVSGVTISPDSIALTQPISLLGGFRYVVVRAVTTGQVPTGYRLTNIYVSPVGVVVFSADPQLVNDLPGYVETKSIDLTGNADDFEVLVEISLPTGISVVGDPRVLVQVSIAAIESSLSISLPVEIVGLTPGLLAVVSPAQVDVIVAGPVPVLDGLDAADIRVKVDLTNYQAGVYQLTPVVDFLPAQVYQVSIIPATVEVVVTLAPTSTPTPTPTPTLLVTPTLTATPRPTTRP